jgi:LPS-assembly lipoprotein
MCQTGSSTLLRNLAICLVFLLSACGFTPVYSKADSNFSNQLASVKIEPIPGRNGQILQYKLTDLLNPSANYVEPQYDLKIDLTKDLRELGIQDTLRVTRYEVILTAKYRLVDLNTGALVDEGKTKIKSSYNRTTSEFSTFVADDDANEKAAEELAQEIRAKLTAYFGK